jgi:hypothetical protein
MLRAASPALAWRNRSAKKSGLASRSGSGMSIGSQLQSDKECRVPFVGKAAAQDSGLSE